MNLNNFELAELISGHLLRSLTKEQKERLAFLLAEDKERYKLFENYKSKESVEERLQDMHDLDIDAAWQKVYARFNRNKSIIKRIYSTLKYAAILAVVIGSVIYFLSLKKSDTRIIADQTKQYKNDVLPGTQTARLILSDGKEVALNNEIQTIADENGVTVFNSDGKLDYREPKLNSNFPIQYNTLVVPKAGTYAIILPDGSKVILNAMSELKFPVSFSGKDRIVQLKGEAYFEVAKDRSHPFKVNFNGVEIEVLGTHFDVSSYDQTAKTTLLEGSVKITNSKSSNILVPGEQAQVNPYNITISKGNIEKAVAWTKGDFYFSSDDLESVLAEISRWYDLKLIYKSSLPKIHVTGHISRKAKLSEVLDMLKDVSDLSFKIDGRNLTIN